MKYLSVFFALSLSLGIVSCSSKKKEPALKDQISSLKITPDNVKKYVSDWPEASRKATIEMLQKHGSPSELSANAIVWNESKPFKKTIVYKEGAINLFPVQHTGVLQQFVDYQVPEGKVQDLWLFTGAMQVDRTRGEVSMRSHKEELNILALNLMNEIILGRLTAADARKEFSTYSQGLEQGNINQYMTTLHFMQMNNTSDPDRGILVPKLEKQAQEAIE